MRPAAPLETLAERLAPGTTALLVIDMQNDFCAPESWGGAFFGVSPRPDERIVEKHTYSAFVNTELDGVLRQLGIRSLVFTGVQTNRCVESSLRDAAALGYLVVVAEDAVASHTPALHDATLTNVRFSFGDVVTAAIIERAWQSAETPHPGMVAAGP